VRLQRVARPERTLVAALEAQGARVEVHALSLRRPGAPASLARPLGWALSCNGRQLAAGADRPPFELARVAPSGTNALHVRACGAPSDASPRPRGGCFTVDPAQCLLVNGPGAR